MKVLKWTFSPKFEKIYTDVLALEKTIEFRQMSQHPNKYFHHRKGFVSREDGKDIVYLNGTMDKKESELVAAHELCHLIVDDEGFKLQFCINEKRLLDFLTEKNGIHEAKKN